MQRHEEPRLRSQQQKATARRGTLDFLVLFLVGAVSFVVGQMLCLPHQEASSPLSEEILPFKKDESRADSRKSKLYDGWLENIYAAAGQVQRPDERIVSFRLFDLSTTLKKVKAPPPFFYPIEETLHSATYIVGNEKNVLDGWMAALRKAQADKTTAANCLDVGSNGGFFSLMSRSAGCRTLAVDAQPWCLQRLSSAAALNEYTTDLDVQWTAVGEDPTQSLEVGANKCSGLWAVTESDWINEESSKTVKVHMKPLLDIVNSWIKTSETIDVFKIDVEGSEMAILHSAIPLFASHRIGSVFVEIAPSRTVKITAVETIVETIDQIYKAGYYMRRITRQEMLDVDGAKALFNDGKARFRGDPDMFAIALKAPKRDNKK